MRYDCIIRGGTVVDGTGEGVPFPADIGITRDKIAAIGNLGNASAGLCVDAGGRIVSPGFIDPHVHSEISLLGGRDQLAGIRQGVTTQLASPDGFGWAPLSPERAREMWRYTQFAYGNHNLTLDWPTVQEYLDLFPGRIPGNLYPQVPHGAVRLRAMGWDARPATGKELDAMLATVREWMEAGAGGISLGLDYQPSANADLRELVTLAKIVASYGGVYAVHARYQVLGRRGAWEETIEVARLSGSPVHISHERVNQETQDLLEKIEADGIDLTFDSYLYPAGMSHMSMMLPMDIQVGGIEEMLRKMRVPANRARSLPHLQERIGESGDQIVGNTRSGRFIGLTLAEAAESVGKTGAEFAYDLVLEEDGVQTFIFPWRVAPDQKERITARTATHTRMMIASDGIYDIPHPHPRTYGCFARVLRHFVRELDVLSLKEAVYKMSGYPARRFGLGDRGNVSQGMAADLIVFDPTVVADRSTWSDPVQQAEGMDWVIVNGVPVIADGTPTGKLPGRVLRRST